MPQTPLVSIIIPCRNAAPMLERCLRSCLDQSYRHIEIILVDNNSTDDSLQVARRVLKGAPFRAVITECSETGPNPARNHGYLSAQGNYIQWLDADDTISQNKIESQVAELEVNASFDVAYGEAQVCIYWDGGTLQHIRVPAAQYEDYLYRLLENLWLPLHSYLFRRSIAQELHTLQAWNPGSMCVCDREYLTTAAILGARFLYVPGGSVEYSFRWSPQQLTRMKNPLTEMETLARAFRRFQKLADRQAPGRIRDHHRYLLEADRALLRFESRNAALSGLDQAEQVLVATLAAACQLEGKPYLEETLERFALLVWDTALLRQYAAQTKKDFTPMLRQEFLSGLKDWIHPTSGEISRTMRLLAGLSKRGIIHRVSSECPDVHP